MPIYESFLTQTRVFFQFPFLATRWLASSSRRRFAIDRPSIYPIDRTEIITDRYILLYIVTCLRGKAPKLIRICRLVNSVKRHVPGCAYESFLVSCLLAMGKRNPFIPCTNEYKIFRRNCRYIPAYFEFCLISLWRYFDNS